eukprot:CAMPEP_0115852248 /NCGR_PEP_ID=MMETSP0287-20121206/12900_1 /TAXON_ID=412157 /ORGANISM="Chrysochromulina rotalis, Strain UIO044" /LENGTH=57 /DNA_ID=CAMNT_0003306307 /DNA_START=555 /DNA_END=728 /DNA_ORIENTATION=-
MIAVGVSPEELAASSSRSACAASRSSVDVGERSAVEGSTSGTPLMVAFTRSPSAVSR